MESVKSKGKPFGFYVCALGFSFERCAFYTCKYLLIIWLATDVAKGGLGFSDSEGTALSASFVAWTYITPMIGGYIADHWISPRTCVALGLAMMGAGYVCVGNAHSMGMVYVMIILVAVGTGLFKGNLSGLNGLLFRNQSELDEAFSIQYSFVNVGAFIGTTFIAVLATKGVLSYNGVFMICAGLIFLDLAWFLIAGRKGFGDAGKTPFKKDTRSFVAAEKKTEEDRPLTALEKRTVIAIMLLTLLSVVFWTLWYLAFMPVYYRFGYGDGAAFLNEANWQMGSFLIPTSWFDSINSIVCIILGPVLAKVWAKMAQRPQGDMSMFRKTALGCLLLGSSYVVMVIAHILAQASPTGQSSVLWLALVCILMSVGEMVFSPLGNSFINKYAPAKLLGFLLGVWSVAVFFAQRIYPPIYDFLATQDFTRGYGLCAAVVIVFGVVLWAFSGRLDDWSEGK